MCFNWCVVEETRLKVQYAVIGEQLKAVKIKKAAIMLRLKDSATATAAAGGGECVRCRTLSAQVAALNRRVVQAAAVRRRRAPRSVDEDVEPSSDGSVRIVGEDAA